MFSPQLKIYEENTMEVFVKLMNTLVTKILLKDFTMWLLFLLLFYLFMPEALSQFFIARTPANFPTWLSLNDIAILLFSLLSLLVWRSLVAFLKSKLNNEWASKSKAHKQLSALSSLEWSVLMTVALNREVPNNDPRVVLAVEKLLDKKLISLSWVSGVYELNPAIRAAVLERTERNLP